MSDFILLTTPSLECLPVDGASTEPAAFFLAAVKSILAWRPPVIFLCLPGLPLPNCFSGPLCLPVPALFNLLAAALALAPILEGPAARAFCALLFAIIFPKLHSLAAFYIVLP